MTHDAVCRTSYGVSSLTRQRKSASQTKLSVRIDCRGSLFAEGLPYKSIRYKDLKTKLVLERKCVCVTDRNVSRVCFEEGRSSLQLKHVSSRLWFQRTKRTLDTFEAEVPSNALSAPSRDNSEPASSCNDERQHEI